MNVPNSAYSRDNLNRFWDKTRLVGECIEWTGAISKNGYGNHGESGKTWTAHRFAYQLVRGDIPDGMVIDHLCRNRRCVRPAHLEVVTQRENVNRGLVGGRTHCVHGHDLSDAILDYHGHRYCRTCNRLKHRARRAASVAA